MNLRKVQLHFVLDGHWQIVPQISGRSAQPQAATIVKKSKAGDLWDFPMSYRQQMMPNRSFLPDLINCTASVTILLSS
jgi:hypothetical protein